MIAQIARVLGHSSDAGSIFSVKFHVEASHTGWLGSRSLSPGIPSFCASANGILDFATFGGAMRIARVVAASCECTGSRVPELKSPLLTAGA